MERRHRLVARRLTGLAVLVAAAVPVAGAHPAISATPRGSITVAVSGSGRVQSSPAGIDCGGTCAASFALGAPVRLTAQPAPGSYLASWGGDCVGASQACDTTADEDARIQAQFASGSPPTPSVHALTVSFSGQGQVTSSPPGIIDCGSNCWTSFSGGGHVTLNATPDAGFVFDGWAGDCSGTGACDVAVTSLRSVVAVFKARTIPPGTSTLTIVNNDPGSGQGTGKIQISWSGHSEECDLDECDIGGVPNGIRVKILPEPGPSTAVTGYGGACQGTAQRCVVVLDQDAGVTTSFGDSAALSTAYGLNLTRSTGGGIQSSPPGIDCGPDTGCSAAFKRNISVTLTPTAADGFAFGGWSGDCSGASSCRVSMTVSRSVAAAFRAIRETVRVIKQGRGTGTVTSEPAGIRCGAVCTYGFRKGEAVTLRAKVDRRSRFRGWAGPCTGRKACELTAESAVDVTATLDRCASSYFAGFGASASRSALVVRLSLADRAVVRVSVSLGGHKLGARTFTSLSAGTRALRVPLGHHPAGARATVTVRVNDPCARTRSLSRALPLP
jgi:List-Bact-rpt repeat protein